MKALLKLFAVLAGLLVILVLAVAIAVTTLDPNEYKGWISNKVQSVTGRSLRLDGEIHLSFYPWLSIEVEDLTLGNRQGFAAEHFMHSDYLLLRLKLLPLLQSEYEVDTIHIRGAEINLEINNEGEQNWSDLMGEGSGGSGQGVTIPLTAMVIGGVSITETHVTWNDIETDSHYEILDLNLTSGELVYDEPIALNMRFTANSNRPDVSAATELKATVSYTPGRDDIVIQPLTIDALVRSRVLPEGQARMALSGDINFNAEKQTVNISNLNLDAMGARLSGQIAITNLGATWPALDADIKAEGGDIALPFRVLEIEPLATQLAAVSDREFSMVLKLDADMDRGDINLPGFSLDLLGANIKGDIKTENARRGNGQMQGTIEASGPDLPTLMQVAGQVTGGKESKLAAYGASFTSLPVRQKAFATVIRFNADMKSGNIEVPALSVSGLGVNVTGMLNASDMQGNAGTVRGNVAVIGQELPAVLRAIGQEALAGALQSFILDLGINGTRSNLVLEPLSLKALFSGKQIPGSSVNLAMSAKTSIDLESQRLQVENLQLKGLGLNVSGWLDATQFRQDPHYNGELSVADFNLRELLSQLNMEIPDTSDTATLRKVSLNSDFQGTHNELKLENLGMVLDETHLQGNLSVHGFSNPAIRFGLDIDAINLDRYLAVETVQDGQGSRQTNETTPLPIETLRGLNASGELHIGQLVVSKARVSDLRLKLDASNGVVRIDPATASLYQGTFTGNLGLDLNGNFPRLTLNAVLGGIQAEPMMTDVMGEGKIRGVGDFDAALLATGADTFSMKQTLNGKMSFRFKDGAIKGYNLGKILRMANKLQSNFSLAVSDREETDFTEITGNPVVSDGVVRLDDLSGKSPAVRLSGAGILADLPNQIMDYTISARLVATSTGQGGKELQEGKLEGVPLDCRLRGPVDSPKRSCDATKLLASMGIRVIENLIKLPVRVLPGSQQAPADSTADDQAADQGTDSDATSERAPVDETLKKAQDALKGLFGR